MKTTRGLVKRILNTPFFEKAIPFHVKHGKGPLVVVVGENASGKSFFRRVASSVCSLLKVEFRGISMEGRSYSTVMSSLIYGDESWESTGVNSLKTVTTGIRTCEGRESPHVIFWDGPDLGLSDGYAAGVGQKLRAFNESPPKHTLAAFVVTHSRALVAELLPSNPTYVHLGRKKAPETLQEWLEKPIKPLDPDELKQKSRRRFKAIQKILNDLKKGDD